MIQYSEKRNSPLKFNDYLRMLPSSWMFEHFLKKGSSGRRILSSSAVQDRSRHFARAETLSKQFDLLSPEMRLQCSLAYLMGETGCAASCGRPDLSDPLIRSFLVYAARNREGKIRYFGFDEFEPLMRGLFARTIAAAGRAKGEPRSRYCAPSEDYCMNDFAIIMALASQGLLVKKRQGGLVRNALLKIARLTHGGQEDRETDRLAELLVSFGLQKGMLCERWWNSGLPNRPTGSVPLSSGSDAHLPDRGVSTCWMKRCAA